MGFHVISVDMSMSWKRGLTAALGLTVIIAVACGTSGVRSPSAPILGAIQGTVTDAGGDPVPGVMVRIASGTVAFPQTVPQTDENGFYEFEGVSPGTFEVSFRDSEGKKLGVASVTVKGGETSRLDAQIGGEPPPE